MDTPRDHSQRLPSRFSPCGWGPLSPDCPRPGSGAHDSEGTGVRRRVSGGKGPPGWPVTDGMGP